MNSVKPFKQETQRYNLYKKATRNTNEPHQQTTTTEHKVSDLGQVQTNEAGFNVLKGHEI